MFTIQNSHLTLTVDPLGAQMQSLRSADGTEYLWVGDSAYWGKHAPNLFPFIGRVYGGKCAAYGQEFPMPRHGFANVSLFSLVEQTAEALTLELTADETTMEKYPFPFALRITYRLADATLSITYSVLNRGRRTMPFALGAHPGFNVPLADGENFEDYYLEFETPCRPDRVGFTAEDVLLSGLDTPYPLLEGRFLPLDHSLFDDDAIILKHMATAVTLRSRRSDRGLTVSYPHMAYLGLWHTSNTAAPFLCIEPWTSLPARQDVVEELTTRSDFVRLAPEKTYENTITITVF